MGPVVKLANVILLSAIKRPAEAFRIRPDETTYVVEFLVDGEATEEMRAGRETFSDVIRRMAVMANLPSYNKGEVATGGIQLLVEGITHYFGIQVEGHGPELTLNGQLLSEAEFYDRS